MLNNALGAWLSGGLRATGRIVGGLALFLAVWELVAISGLVDQDYLPRVGTVFGALGGYLASGQFWTEYFRTLLRLLAGFALALLVGLGLALMVGRYVRLARMLAPAVAMARALPPPAVVPLLVFFLGIGNGLVIFVVVFGCIWPVYINASSALTTAEPVQMFTARSFGYRPWDILMRVRLPAAVPEIMTGVRQSAAIALLATIAAEMLAGDTGLGNLMFNAGFSMQIPQMFALIFVIGATGILISALLTAAYWVVGGWQLKLSAMGART